MTHEEPIFCCTAGQSGRRIDRFLSGKWKTATRSRIQRMIREGRVQRNGETVKRIREPVAAGDRIAVGPSREKEPAPPARAIPELRSLYRDGDIWVIDKPTGLTVHPPSPGYPGATVMEALLRALPPGTFPPSDHRPGIVHRLDRDTSGVLILALHPRAKEIMQEQFRRREVEKTYLAAIHGRPPFLNGRIEKALVRNQRRRRTFRAVPPDTPGARNARTHYTLLLHRNRRSLLRLHPRTGRTHQLRVHLQSIGHPIVGDPLYGKKKDNFSRLALHAGAVRFRHPRTGFFIGAHSPLPPAIRQLFASGTKSQNS